MLLHSLAHSLNGHQQLLVGYSGGLDSTVLLHQLVMLRQQQPELQIRAIHIHHGLNPLAGSWVEHCQQQCRRWQVELTVVCVTLAAQGKGIEAAARTARYHAFAEHLQPGECLLTAQHQDDQCETLLLALKRGSGPAGLSAMPVESLSRGHRLLRPLLALTRQQLEAWATEHDLCWTEDDSNQNTRFDRNFLRQVIVPQLTARWPHFSQAVARSASLCAEQEQLLDELLAESLNALEDQQGSLAIAPLLGMSDARRGALLRRWIARRQGLMPSRDALLRIWQEVACSREDADPCLLLGSHQVRRYRNRLYWLESGESLRERVIEWPASEMILALPAAAGWLTRIEPEALFSGEERTSARVTNALQVIVHSQAAGENAAALSGSKTVTIRAPLAQERVTVRFQAQGKFHRVGRAGSRPLKKHWQELAVPPWLRERTPLIFYDDYLIAAVGVFVTREGDPGEQPGWLVCWQPHLRQKAQ